MIWADFSLKSFQQRLAEETERIKKYQLQKEAEEAGRQTKRAEESAAKEHVQSKRFFSKIRI